MKNHPGLLSGGSGGSGVEFAFRLIQVIAGLKPLFSSWLWAKTHSHCFFDSWSPASSAEKAMAPHSSTLAWRIPRTEEPGRLQSMGSLSRAQLSDFTFTFHFHALEKEMATHSSIPAWRIPGTEKPSGLSSVGSHRVGHDWSNLAAAASLLLSQHLMKWSNNTCQGTLRTKYNHPCISTS